MDRIDERQMFQLNPYDEYVFQLNDNSWWTSKVPNGAAILWNRYNNPYWGETLHHTPRDLMRNQYIPATTFYYLEHILKSSDGPIIDIGCGSNWFKTFNRNIVGLDTSPAADIQGFFTDEFIDANQNNYTHGIAINSLHFKINVDQMWDQILQFMSVIRPGGFGFITFNAGVLYLFSTPEETFRGLRNIIWNINQNIEPFIKAHPEFEFQIVDQVYYDPEPDQGELHTNGEYKIPNIIDGNIRFLIKKKV